MVLTVNPGHGFPAAADTPSGVTQIFSLVSSLALLNVLHSPFHTQMLRYLKIFVPYANNFPIIIAPISVNIPFIMFQIVVNIFYPPLKLFMIFWLFCITKLIAPPLPWVCFVHSERIFSASFAVDHSSFCASSCSILFVSLVILTAICSVLFSLKVSVRLLWYHCSKMVLDKLWIHWYHW